MLRTLFVAAIWACLWSAAASAQETKVTPLMQVDLKDSPGREGLMITVDLPPGDPGSKHRHNAHTFVYVLQGSVVMQVEGGERKVLKAGDTFYETPDDIHAVGMNASKTEPAKLLVFFIKEKGAPPVVPVP
jgi:quercetin dioxygenase-like cupin family protein